MFFHQDDIGLLVILEKTPFKQLLFTSFAQRFAPIYWLIVFLEYKLFGLNFTPYVMVVVFFHILNCFILGKIVYKLTGRKVYVLVAILLFIINISYTEPILWLSAQGEVMAATFLGLGFYYWLDFLFRFTGPAACVSQNRDPSRSTDILGDSKVHDLTKYFYSFYLLARSSFGVSRFGIPRLRHPLVKSKVLPRFIYAIFFVILAGWTYGVGVGVGVVFAVASWWVLRESGFNKWKWLAGVYLLAGFLSYLPSVFLYGNIVPSEWRGWGNPINSVVGLISFVIVGVGRGLIGRLFLPGYEPEREDVVGTIISFIPALIILMGWLGVMMGWGKGGKREKGVKWEKALIGVFGLFTIYPYIWAGLIRYQFGLKQALAERYVYTALFFFVILLSLIIKYYSGYILKLFKLNTQNSKVKTKYHNSHFHEINIPYRIQKLFIIGVFVIFVLQGMQFFIKAREFEKRPMMTKKYFRDYAAVLRDSLAVLELPLPSYINQDFLTTNDLAPVLVENKTQKFIKARGDFCTNEFNNSLKIPLVVSFYKEQVRDGSVARVLGKDKLEKCLKQIKR